MAAALNIVIPVFNEHASFPALWQALTSQVRSPFVALVVFDHDHDSTVPVVREIMSKGASARLRLVRNHQPGVVGAILAGFEQVQDGPVLVVMADLSDDLGRVDRMLELYRQGYHIVCGSRYIPGGEVRNGPWLKQTLSRLAGVSLARLRGLPTHDATNAFKIYDRQMLRSLRLESRQGFELNLEITVKAFLGGYKITEIPSVWQERTAGKSKFKMWRWLPHYLKWYLWAFRPRRKDSGQDDSKALELS